MAQEQGSGVSYQEANPGKTRWCATCSVEYRVRDDFRDIHAALWHEVTEVNPNTPSGGGHA